MHDPVQPVPAGAQVAEQRLDLLVAGHVARKDQIAAEVGCQSHHAVFDALALVGEGERRALAVHGLGDAVRDGPVAEQPGDQDLLVAQEAHYALPSQNGEL